MNLFNNFLANIWGQVGGICSPCRHMRHSFGRYAAMAVSLHKGCPEGGPAVIQCAPLLVDMKDLLYGFHEVNFRTRFGLGLSHCWCCSNSPGYWKLVILFNHISHYIINVISVTTSIFLELNGCNYLHTGRNEVGQKAGLKTWTWYFSYSCQRHVHISWSFIQSPIHNIFSITITRGL